LKLLILLLPFLGYRNISFLFVLEKMKPGHILHVHNYHIYFVCNMFMWLIIQSCETVLDHWMLNSYWHAIWNCTCWTSQFQWKQFESYYIWNRSTKGEKNNPQLLYVSVPLHFKQATLELLCFWVTSIEEMSVTYITAGAHHLTGLTLAHNNLQPVFAVNVIAKI
jgi:hypothetical protein